MPPDALATKKKGQNKQKAESVTKPQKDQSCLSLSGSGESKNSSDDDEEWSNITSSSNSQFAKN